MGPSSKLKDIFRRRGYEIFILILFGLTVFAFFAGAGKILLKMLLSAAFGFLALFLAGDKLEEVLNKLGVGKYWRTITIICFIIIGLWNWLALILLLAFLIVLNLI